MVCDGQIDKQLEKVTYKGGAPPKKCEKHPWRSVTFGKVHFLNCTNVTISIQ